VNRTSGEISPHSEPLEAPRAAFRSSDHAKPDETDNAEASADPKIKEAALPTSYNSFEDELDAYSDRDKQYMRKFNESLFGALNYDNEHQRKWKTEQGYPTIENVLRARDMTDEALLNWALSGDRVGAQLYFKRRLDELTEMESVLGVNPKNRGETLDENQGYRQLNNTIRALQRDLYLTDSPFAAYLMAEFTDRLYSDQFTYPEIAIAAIRGDQNAMQQVENVMRSLRPQVMVTPDGVPIEGYDKHAVDQVIAFFHNGLLVMSRNPERELVCPDN
jgi:hypothetical protein